MSIFTLGKKCERCDVAIPDDYGNLLCDQHYEASIVEQEAKKKEREEQAKAELLKNPENPTHPSKTEPLTPVYGKVDDTVEVMEVSDVIRTAHPHSCDHSDCGISDPNYKENPEADDKDQILANLAQFIYTHRDKEHPKGRKKGIMLYYPQRNMYNFIRNYCVKKAMAHPQYPKFLWKPKIVDIGCGSGVGANIMSQEADFVWGIDKNEFSIEFAQECFTREKNGYYYSGQLTFDVIDLFNDTRQFMAFDIVVSIEVAEHVWDINGFLNQLKRFTKRDKKGAVIADHPTEFFISTPNRAHAKLRKDKPENPFHVREWTKTEFENLLKKHFENVEILNQKGEPVTSEDGDQIVFAKCSVPK